MDTHISLDRGDDRGWTHTYHWIEEMTEDGHTYHWIEEMTEDGHTHIIG